MREPERILGDPSVKQLIDLTKPVALLALAVVHFIPVEDDAEGIMARYRNALAPGSYLVVTHATADDMPETVGGVQEIYQENMTTATPRTRSPGDGAVRGLRDPGPRRGVHAVVAACDRGRWSRTPRRPGSTEGSGRLA